MNECSNSVLARVFIHTGDSARLDYFFQLHSHIHVLMRVLTGYMVKVLSRDLARLEEAPVAVLYWKNSSKATSSIELISLQCYVWILYINIERTLIRIILHLLKDLNI